MYINTAIKNHLVKLKYPSSNWRIVLKSIIYVNNTAVTRCITIERRRLVTLSTMKFLHVRFHSQTIFVRVGLFFQSWIDYVP